jgi:hypothetical protein
VHLNFLKFFCIHANKNSFDYVKWQCGSLGIKICARRFEFSWGTPSLSRNTVAMTTLGTTQQGVILGWYAHTRPVTVTWLYVWANYKTEHSNAGPFFGSCAAESRAQIRGNRCLTYWGAYLVSTDAAQMLPTRIPPSR